MIVVFILSALWWLRIRGLWKLPDGEDSLWGRLGLVLMGRTMLSKSSIQFPPCCLVWGQTMVGEMKVMVTSFKMTSAHTVVFSASDPTTDQSQSMPPLEIPGHSQANLAQSLVGTLLLSPGSWCAQGFVCVLQESVSPVLWKFCNQIPWSPKSNSLGVFSSFARSPGWEVCCGF